MAVAAKSAGKAPARKASTKAGPKAAAKPAKAPKAAASAEPKVAKGAARSTALTATRAAPRAATKVAPKPAAKAATKAAAPARAAKAPAAAKRAATPKVAEALSWTQISTELAEQHELTKRQAREILDGAIEMVTGHLRKGGKVRIGGLGILSVRKREARMGRNPATGEQIRIKASKKVALRVAKELKESI